MNGNYRNNNMAAMLNKYNEGHGDVPAKPADTGERALLRALRLL